MNLRVVLADDEPLARERLRRLLAHDKEVEIVAECEDGISTVHAVERHDPDLLLLDIQMPGLDGFEALSVLSPLKVPALIIVTGYDQHAIRAFEERALDYLLKPTSQGRLAQALARARERLRSKQQDCAGAVSGHPQLKRILIRKGDRTSFVSVDDISWIESAGNYVVLHCADKNHVCRETLAMLNTQLAPKFVRSSRSTLINLDRVCELRSISPGHAVAVLDDGKQVPVTRSIRELENQLRFR